MKVKNRLNEIMHELKIDHQKEMAALLGVSPNQYNRYIKQKDQPALLKALLIAQRLNKPMEEIFYIDEPPED